MRKERDNIYLIICAWVVWYSISDIKWIEIPISRFSIHKIYSEEISNVQVYKYNLYNESAPVIQKHLNKCVSQNYNAFIAQDTKTQLIIIATSIHAY